MDNFSLTHLSLVKKGYILLDIPKDFLSRFSAQSWTFFRSHNLYPSPKSNIPYPSPIYSPVKSKSKIPARNERISAGCIHMMSAQLSIECPMNVRRMYAGCLLDFRQMSAGYPSGLGYGKLDWDKGNGECKELHLRVENSKREKKVKK